MMSYLPSSFSSQYSFLVVIKMINMMEREKWGSITGKKKA